MRADLRELRPTRAPVAGERIPISAPALVGRELEYVTSCLQSTWISSRGEYVSRFESAFAALCGVRHGVAVCNGTAALHTALVALEVGPGDEVLMPSLTYMANDNTVMYTGARPVFVDSDAQTWNIDAARVAEAITPRTRGIVAVHLYGHPADMDALRTVADEHGLFLLEDAAQAHGAGYRGRRAGSLGDVSAFSFYGGKLITTGEGGMCLTDDDELAELMRRLRDQGQDPSRRYVVGRLGFNYRMTNVAAAIGLGQVERADWHIARRHANALRYRERLGDHDGLRFQAREPWAQSADWLTSVVVQESVPVGRDRVMVELEALGIESRPVFPPLHAQPVYASGQPAALPVCEKLGACGLSLPSGAGLTEAQVDRVCDALLGAIAGG
jgi:perosamine synthetase